MLHENNSDIVYPEALIIGEYSDKAIRVFGLILHAIQNGQSVPTERLPKNAIKELVKHHWLIVDKTENGDNFYHLFKSQDMCIEFMKNRAGGEA